MDFAYICINANMHTPLAVYKGLSARFLLESASLLSGKGRYSIIIKTLNFALSKEYSDMAQPNTKHVQYFFQDFHNNQKYNIAQLESYPNLPPILQTLQQKLYCNNQNTKQDSKQSTRDRQINFDFLSLAQELRQCYPQIPKELEDLPLPLGGLGFVGYEFFSECEKVVFNKPSLYHAPQAMLVFPKETIIFDHLYDEMYIIANGYNGCEVGAKKLIEQCRDSLSHSIHTHTPIFTNNTTLESTIIYEDSQEWYEKHVSIIKDEIYKGTFLQCVLSRSVAIQSNMNPLYFYETLRRQNPSPYMYYLDFGEFKIIGASPEVMLQCKDSVQILRPIAGTRKRGQNLQEDKILEEDLLADDKENAEHLMLVDLARNDIGKNAKIGSVKLNAYKIIEKYSEVMHIVSEVSGIIADDKTSNDCFKACFPAGTVSGAPKIEAINKLHDYETHNRSIYAGAILYFKQNGDINSAITLRSTVFVNNVYYLQAGAGIVIDSNPNTEYFETCNKMKALYDILMPHS